MSTESARFWAKVDRSAGDDACWTWTAARIPEGYGSFSILRDGHWRRVGAHRWAYAAAMGPIAPGLVVDHLCRNRACVNPAHLESVTQRTNVLRSLPYVQRPPACPQGHEYTTENTYRTPRGHRQCRQCNCDRAAAAHRRKAS